MRKISKYIKFNDIKYVIQLYCRGKDKYYIHAITKITVGNIEAIIEQYANNYIKNRHRRKYDIFILKVIIKAAEAGISNQLLSKYFNISITHIGFIIHKYCNMILRQQNYKLRQHNYAIQNIIAKRLKNKQETLMRRNLKKQHKLCLIELEDKRNLTLPIPIYQKYYVNKCYFDIIDTEEKAYWLGFLAADGCVYDNELHLNLSFQDIEHIVKFRKAINSNHRINYIKNNNNFSKGLITRQYSLIISNKYLITALSKYNIIPRKSFIVTMPDIAENLKLHYIRGIIDADGSLYYNDKYAQLNIAGNMNILTAINNYIKQYCGITKKLSKIKSIYQLQYSTQPTIKLLTYFYQNASIYLERKYQKYLQIIKKFCSC